MREQPFILIEQLHRYAITLATTLRSRGLIEPSDGLDRACKFVIGSPSEFFGETRLALQRVMELHNGALTDAEVFQLKSILNNISKELSRVNSG